MDPLSTDPEPESRRGAVASACRDLYRRGWMEGTAGNVSLRTGGTVVISASGRSKGRMSRGDTVLVDAASGRPRAGETEWPSAETAIHLAVYRRIEDCGAVVHTHAPHATAVAALTAVPGAVGHAHFADLELAKGLGVEDPRHVRVGVFPNWPDVSRIARDVAAYLADRGPRPVPALLIARHGATTWGRDLEQARNRMECIEALCRLSLLTGVHTTGPAEETT